MTKKLTKVAMTTALAASAIVPAVVATPAQAAEAEVTFAKAYYTTANGTAAFTAGELGGVIASTTNKEVTYLEGSNGEVFTMTDYSGYLAANPTATPNEVLTALSTAGKALSADQVKALNVKEGKVEGGKVTADADAPVADVKVESVSAINKTTVEVKLNVAVDSVKAENFTIEGASVTSATLSEDKKTVTLSVSGLDYEKEYTVAAKDILVDGEKTDFGTKTFKTPAVNTLWDLEISAANNQLLADGADNTILTFKLINKVTGEVDVNADNVVLDLNTTYGTLASKRVTIQDGVGTVLLTSEFSNTNIATKIDAQIIEASGDYKDLIGKVLATTSVNFVTSDTENVDTITLVSAEANQSDRFTLFFDKTASLKHFVDTNAAGELLYEKFDGSNWVKNFTADELVKVDAKNIRHQMKNPKNAPSIVIEQGSKTNFVVKGFKPVAGNAKALEVILEKDVVLTDNANVNITVNTVNSLNKVTKSDVDFKVTDARNPEATSVKVEGLDTLKVKFSESIDKSNFTIDGRFVSVTHFTSTFGEFNPSTLEDTRDVATIKLLPAYKETADSLAGYFTAGTHTVQVSNTEDFASRTDSQNKGTTQNLNFTIAEDKAKPTAMVSVESPEQFRIKFDKSTTLTEATLANELKFNYYDAKAGEYKLVNATKFADAASQGVTNWTTADLFNITKVDATEFVVELKHDWTKIYNTKDTNENYYNDKFQFVIDGGKVTNVANGLTNEKIVLDLNASGSVLNTPDVTSPTIDGIERVSARSNKFDVTISEPVKLNFVDAQQTDKDQADTLAQGQTALPETTVQFIGKDKDGKTVTINGKTTGYSDTDEKYTDKVLRIEWDTTPGVVTPQAVVDQGGSEDWTLVVRSLSDDVGNTVASATKAFKIAKQSMISEFYVLEETAANKGTHQAYAEDIVDPAKDTVRITFSEGVKTTGSNAATNSSFYTLNGKTLPSGTTITVQNSGGSTTADANGFEELIITLPDGTLNAGSKASNVITINKALESYDGSIITKDTEIVLYSQENVNAAAAQPVIDAITALDNTAPTFATDVAAARTAYDALSADQQALVTNVATLTAAESEVADVAAVAADKALVNVTPLTNLVANPTTITAAGLLANGSTLTWTGATGAIDTSGVITRDAYNPTEAVADTTSVATLTATIAKGAASDTKVFNLTVKDLAPATTGTVAGGTADFANGVALSSLGITINDDDATPTAISGLNLATTGLTLGTPSNLTDDLVGKTVSISSGNLTIAGLNNSETGTFTLPVTDVAGRTFTLTVTVTQS